MIFNTVLCITRLSRDTKKLPQAENHSNCLEEVLKRNILFSMGHKEYFLFGFTSFCVYYNYSHNGVSFFSFCKGHDTLSSFYKGRGHGNLYRTSHQRTRNHRTNHRGISVYVNDDST